MARFSQGPTARGAELGFERTACAASPPLDFILRGGPLNTGPFCEKPTKHKEFLESSDFSFVSW